jgi:hypothetical protein
MKHFLAPKWIPWWWTSSCLCWRHLSMRQNARRPMF